MEQGFVIAGLCNVDEPLKLCQGQFWGTTKVLSGSKVAPGLRFPADVLVLLHAHQISTDLITLLSW